MIRLFDLVREGEMPLPYHAAVRPRPEFLGTETALIGLHWLAKLYHHIRRSSYREWTEEEIRTVPMALKVMNERGERRYQQGYQKGLTDGEDRAARVFHAYVKIKDAANE